MSVNKVILLGRLGRDPEVRYMPNGEAVCNFSIATSESWKDKTGQKQERTEWHNITIYRKLAEIAGEYLAKGREVYIEGKIQSRKYTGKDGIERTAYEIIASEMRLIGGRYDNSNYATRACFKFCVNDISQIIGNTIIEMNHKPIHSKSPVFNWHRPSF